MKSISRGLEIIKNGGVVAFPTETVYGLGADATNEAATLKIYELKNRPKHNPLIVHCFSTSQAQEIAKFNDDAVKLAEKLWPGPISFVLPKKRKSEIAANVTAGLGTVCLRVPKHDLALALIQNSGVPIAAPSANISNYISSTEYIHVKKQFPDIHVIDGGPCVFGLESTILDLSSGTPKILRHGFITANTISNILGIELQDSCYNGGDTLLAPGMMKKHYSPKTKLRINATFANENEIALNYGNSGLKGAFSLNLSRAEDLIESASNLYKMLIALDEYAAAHNITSIAVAPIPNEGIGIAINDRLIRASF